MTEKEKMLAGADYDARDPELLARYHEAHRLLDAFNASATTDAERRRTILDDLLGHMGADVWVEAPFRCEYGEHIHLGARTYLNVNCVFLDCNRIEVGADALIGPGVHVYTASHPTKASERVIDGWTPAQGGAPYRTRSAPVVLGRAVWIGGGTLVMPGVAVGAGTTVAAGSLVTRDLPAGVLAMGRPCRVVRSLG